MKAHVVKGIVFAVVFLLAAQFCETVATTAGWAIDFSALLFLWLLSFVLGWLAVWFRHESCIRRGFRHEPVLNRLPHSPRDLCCRSDVVQDPSTGNNYLYDVEGRICAMGANMGGAVSYTQYVYDAEGRRVAKGNQASLQCPVPTSANGFTLTNQYLLGQSGEQLSELDGSSQWLHSNVYAGGQMLGTYDPTRLHFTLTDPLGTRRVQVQAGGTPELNCTSLPFGNDLAFNRSTNCYTPANGVADADASEIHFTAKERDSESGNDYFESRY
jgi:hypothetical protein